MSLDNKSVVQQVVKFLHCSFVNTAIVRNQAVCHGGFFLCYVSEARAPVRMNRGFGPCPSLDYGPPACYWFQVNKQTGFPNVVLAQSFYYELCT